MKLAEVLSKSQLLQAQQDFIELFPDNWSFDIIDNKLVASVENDRPMFFDNAEIELPNQNVNSATRARADIEADLKCRKVNVKIIGGKVLRGYLDDAKIEFHSYVDAFEYYVRDYGGDYAWNQYGNSFTADDIWDRIEELTTS